MKIINCIKQDGVQHPETPIHRISCGEMMPLGIFLGIFGDKRSLLQAFLSPDEARDVIANLQSALKQLDQQPAATTKND